MSKKKQKLSIIQSLNDYGKPYNLQVSVGAGKPDEANVTVNLVIMDEARVVEGKTVQPSHRVIQTTAFGKTVAEAKEAALTEALQYAGVI